MAAALPWSMVVATRRAEAWPTFLRVHEGSVMLGRSWGTAMDSFSYFITFYSLILGLGLTELLGGFAHKQMGDACEMLVAAELTLAGIPALKVPDNWPHYDVIAQPVGQSPQRISVKSRTYKPGPAYVEYNDYDEFDWLAIVLIVPGDCTNRSLYIVPRADADKCARRDRPTSKTARLRYFRIDQIDELFASFQNNFGLSNSTGAASE